ncbi:MAG: LamG-like jellyroll fold domain-containing protein [Phycisphaerales bacterium JB060]
MRYAPSAAAVLMLSCLAIPSVVVAQHGEPSGSSTSDGAREPGVMDEGYKADERTPFLFHQRHLHTHNRPHSTVAPDGTRFFTTRDSSVTLPLPGETEAFVFAIFGDRTGGPDLGINVLADAVRDVNLIEPDLVLTVGDLIDGYNQTDEWMTQMTEYKTVMGQLLCPWFPVAGNHDIYWRGDDRPGGEHEQSYEMHFGPLWYSFMHKGSHFIVLYTDEGDPQTGEKNFRKPASQAMSEDQRAFLAQALERGQDATHQFVFVHHPRWLGGGYGDDWNENVHPMLVEAGNVRAVFAGHIHRMRHDFGPQGDDGIEYVTLATVGGGQSHQAPQAGWLHQYHLITVRPDQIAMTAYPVGAAMNVREITGEMADRLARQARQGVEVDGQVTFGAQGGARGEVALTLENTTDRQLQVEVSPNSRDNRWLVRPDHTHAVLAAGEKKEFAFLVGRPASSADEFLDRLSFAVDADYLGQTARYALPRTEVEVPVDLSSMLGSELPLANMALDFDGVDDAIRIPSGIASFDQGPFTVECWFNARNYEGRRGLLTKTQGSEYGFFVSNGVLGFSNHLGGSYRNNRVADSLKTDTWHHVAAVYDGNATRVYLDGHLVSTEGVDPAWKRTANNLPLFVGADPDGAGNPMSFFEGQIDEVRLSSTARYLGERFSPERRLSADSDTVALYTFDRSMGPYVLDTSGHGHHARRVGSPKAVDAR